MKIKFVIRRALAGIVIVPATALIYTIGYAMLVGLGGTPTASVGEVWGNGLMLGIVATAYLMFHEPINKLLDRLN